MKMTRKRLLPILALLIIVTIIWRVMAITKQDSPSYETATVTRSALISSISASGAISSGNSTAITTKASGTVKKVYVNNGDTVEKGAKIAEISLDEYGIEQQAASYADYIAAVAAVKTAQKSKVDTDIAMWRDQQAILNAEDAIETKNSSGINPATKKEYTESEKAVIDKTLEQSRLAFAVTEYNYKNANAAIADASAKVTSAWRDYQEYSAVITAPAKGVVNGLTLASGMVIERVLNTNANNLSVTSQNIGEINNPEGQLQASVSLTQMDIIKVKSGQKVTLTLDAYSDKTFTGKVLSLDTNGSVSSNVTSYAVTILLDKTETVIYPNMAVTAQIITDLKNDVLLIPTTAITTQNSQSTVQVLKDKQASTVTVVLGSSNDSQTEIISGLNEGDIVITATITSVASNTTDDASSPFSTTNRSGNSTGTGTGTNRAIFQMGGGPPPGGF